MTDPKIDLTEIFSELDGLKKSVAYVPTEQELAIIKHARPDVSYRKIAEVINKHFKKNVNESQIKYYVDKNGL